MPAQDIRIYLFTLRRMFFESANFVQDYIVPCQVFQGRDQPNIASFGSENPTLTDVKMPATCSPIPTTLLHHPEILIADLGAD
jgi:hypothetical protein